MKRKLFTFLTLFFLGIGIVTAQTQVRGTIVDESGVPIIGATIQVKGTGMGTVTDFDGNFSLSAPSNGTLVISYVGLKTQELPVSTRVNVTLLPDTELLDEVVVTALGISRDKKTLGYATQEVKAEDLIKTRQGDLNNALVGKVSGVKFTGASGATFDAGSIVLRGTSTLDPRGSSPIYVVDGVITSANSVNMDDVESVNVLKGPAATAVYGSRGGNGAIIITTKGVKNDTQEITVSHTLSFDKIILNADYQSEYGGGNYGASESLNTFHYDPAKHPSYLQKLDGAHYYDYGSDVSWGPKYDPNINYAPWYAWDPTHPKFGQQIPWVSAPKDDVLNLYETGVSNITNIAFAKSGKDYMTRISFTNSVKQGVVPNSDATRRFLSFKTSYKVTDKLNVSLDYKYTLRKNHNGAQEGYGGERNAHYTFQQWFNRNVFINDLKDYVRPDGSYRSWNITSPTNLTPAYHNNPFALFNEINSYGNYQWNVFNGNVTYDILDNLKASFIVNGNIRNYQGEFSAPEGLLGITSQFNTDQNTLFDMQYQGMLSYDTKFLDNRIIWDINLFTELRDYKYEAVNAFTRDGLYLNKFYSVSASNGLPGGGNEKSYQQDKSIFGTTSLSLDDTYFAELSLRNDWTTTLSPENNSYLYGGASLSVLAHKWINADWLNFWKLRSSAAQVGSTMSPYRIYPTYIGTNNSGIPYKYGQLTEMQLDVNLKNPNIKPTISTSYEVGTEFRMLNNRFWGDFNIYRRDSKNQIINVDVAPQSGYTSRVENAGMVRNEGVELSLGGDIVKTRDWTWTVNANYSKNRNKLMELLPGVDQYELYWMGFSNYIYSYAEVGKPIGVLRGTDFMYDPDGNLVLKKFTDPNTIAYYGEYDIVRNLDATTYLGNVQPLATGGFSTSIDYKGIRLSATFDYQVGGLIASITNMFGEGSGLLSTTVGKNKDGVDIRESLAKGGGMDVVGVVNEGTADNPKYTKVETRMNPELYYAVRKSGVWGPNLYDASYVKMRELSLSYSIPRTLLNKLNIGLKDASFSLIATNPWLIYSGTPNIDPSELAGSNYGFIEGGQSYSTRGFGFTVSATF